MNAVPRCSTVIASPSGNRLAIALAALGILISASLQARVIYVRAGAVGANDGTSWPNAYASLQDALASAAAGDEIWVAKGVYFPDIGAGVVKGNPEATFALKSGVALYGGFIGSEAAREQRNFIRHRASVLSGDLLGNDAGATDPADARRSENSVHVLTARGLDSTAIIDGFTVIGGNANLRSLEGSAGAGLLCVGGAVSMRNCEFTGNVAAGAGGAVASFDASISVAFSNFSSNSATSGGALSVEGRAQQTVWITNTYFWDNHAVTEGGALRTTRFASPVIAGCVFSQNVVSGPQGLGGALSCTGDSLLSIVNCTFSQNAATGAGSAGGGAHFQAGEIANCIFWQNVASADSQIARRAADPDPLPTVRNSIVQGGLPGTLITDSDPQFADAAEPKGADGLFGTPDDGLRVTGFSPAIDEGYITATPIKSDILGNPRFANVVVDIGAFEAPRVGSVDHSGVLTDLRRGGLVVVFRHAITDWRQRDSSAWTTNRDDCSLQRNLNAYGLNQATRIGGYFRALGIPYATPVSSPMCRTRQTSLRAFGGYTDSDIWINDPSRQLPERREMLATAPPAGTNAVIVTHQLAIISVTTFEENEMSEGDCIILRPLGGGVYQEIDHWTPDLLERLANSMAADVDDPRIGSATAEVSSLMSVPNPCSDAVTVRFVLGAPANVGVEISDALGRPVYSLDMGRLTAGPNAVTAELGGLPSGAYFCTVRTAGSVHTVPILVAH